MALLKSAALAVGVAVAVLAAGAGAGRGVARAAVPYNFTLQPETSTVATVGQTVALDVHIDNVTNMSAFQFKLAYDPTLVTVQSVSQGPLISSSSLQGITCLGPDFSAANDQVTYGCASVSGTPVVGSGIAATVTFITHAQGTAQVTFLSATTADALSDPLCGYNADRSALQNCPWTGATIQIGAPPPGSPTPTPPSSANGGGSRPTPTPQPASTDTPPLPGNSVASGGGPVATTPAGVTVPGAAPVGAAAGAAASPRAGVAAASAGSSASGPATKTGKFGTGPEPRNGDGGMLAGVELLLAAGAGMLGGGIIVRRRLERRRA
ncbi:MAG TPA: cohesin domain-containing protein [Dehalococcoidia bacterium]|nr:cohesin domain-containing protein [Dehalococcoidia bacterium]